MKWCLGDLASASRGVILQGRHSVALSINPIVVGHAVVVPVRESVRRLSELSAGETVDLFSTARAAARIASASTGASAFNISLDDGCASTPKGATLHVHVVPRLPGDFEPDAVFSLIERWTPVDGETHEPPPWQGPSSDEERLPRTQAAMAAEAGRHRRAAQAAGVGRARAPAEGETIPFGHVALHASQFFHS